MRREFSPPAGRCFRLYNLDADPGEQRDVSAENRRVVDELVAALREHLQRAGSVPWQNAGR